MALLAFAKRFLLFFCLLSTSSCVQRYPDVTIEAGDPLKFVLSGKGIVDYLSVSGDKSRNALHMYWQIAPLKETDLKELEKFGPITYGKVPPGFRQVVPEHGEPEPIHQDEQADLYWVNLEMRNEHDAGKRFTFRAGKILMEGEGSWR